MHKWVVYSSMVIFVLIILAAIVGGIYEMVGRNRAARDFPPPGILVDIGGRRIQLDCRGSGSPGVGFWSLTESIDTTTSGGRLIFHVFGALGQFERDLIRDRTKAGLAAAAARGRKGGRKPVVNDERLQRARKYMAKGLNVREAAARLKIGKTALYAALQAASEADF